MKLFLFPVFLFFFYTETALNIVEMDKSFLFFGSFL